MVPAPIDLDDKQFRLVRAWMKYGAQDEYGRFISLWVAFNALCYAKYAAEAHQLRADLDLKKSSGLSAVQDKEVPASGTLSKDAERIKLHLDTPGPVTIKIVERYTEDVIFDRFATDYQTEYKAWLAGGIFRQHVDALFAAIAKDQKHYIVNMAKANKHQLKPDSTQYKEMRAAGVIVAWEDTMKLSQLKSVLYQIRNNVFHGEKVPGEANDDRIVKVASPVLQFICERLTPEKPGA